MRKPLVALVGRPNVGKSALFNRLVGQRKAVVSEVPGTTRDRLFGEVEWNGVLFNVVDTGGLEVYQPKQAPRSPLEEGSERFVEEIREQALLAITDADVIVFVVDAIEGITAADEEVATILHKTNKPVIVAANKADNEQRRTDAFEFYALGMDEVFPVSAFHGTGTGDLLDAVVEALPFRPTSDMLDEADEDDPTIHIAIIGRPNVGKSSLLNKLLGQERAIVSPVAGTTRDAVDTSLTWNGIPLTLIDTAGIRRRGRIEPGVEKYSVLRAIKAIERADVALVLIDATEGVTQQDANIAGMVQEAMKSAVIVVNKWDLIEKGPQTMNEFKEQVRRDLAFMPYVPVLFVSAKTGQRIHTVLETAVQVQEERMVRIPTSELNTIVREAMLKHAPATKQPRPLKIFMAQQVRVDPPTFLFHVNDTRLLHFTYERYLENQIREHYPFTGTPIRLSFRPRDEDRVGVTPRKKR